MKSIRDLFQALKAAPLLFVVPLVSGGIMSGIYFCFVIIGFIIAAIAGFSARVSYSETYQPHVEIGIGAIFIIGFLYVVVVTTMSAFFSGGLFTVSRNALVEGKIKISQLFSGGAKYFWKMVVFDGILTFFGAVILALYYTFNFIQNDVFRVVVMILLYIILICLSLAFGLSKMGIIVHDLTIGESIKSAFRLQPRGYLHIFVVFLVNIVALLIILLFMSIPFILFTLLGFLILAAYGYFLSVTVCVWLVAVYRNYAKV
ncbi:hypothetical protein A374_18801 [Fictibacillus macauensis ZFHKF-1]|uniref:Uncharacterized protein n=1 Tax=Fictibacillus macauensis ZFHKF-1 TaxID=1196324 RepID=I8UAC8_9BACL|nr:hypothetical protein [Fictibacillus macauensis]EIT83768.1 hypothetical protein A374_18801 [Fictibacillus macauensis ZFHKF-1]